MSHVKCEHGRYPHCEPCDSEEKLDRLVQEASRPKLADLYRAGLKQGLLKAIKNYH